MKPTIVLSLLLALLVAWPVAAGLYVAAASAQPTAAAPAAPAASSPRAAAPAIAPDPAPAATQPTPDDLGAFLAALAAAAKEKAWLTLAALVIGAAVWGLRLLKKRNAFKWLGTKWGGALLVLLVAALAEVGTAIAGLPPGSAALPAVLAAGGRAILRGLLSWLKGEPDPEVARG